MQLNISFLRSKAQKRLLAIVAIFVIVSSGIAITLYFAGDNIVFFLKPSEIKEENLGKTIRVGGLVVDGSIYKMQNRVIMFDITDGTKNVTIVYKGILPGLFREGQGIVAEGVMDAMDGKFVAEKLLTKHDENYRPPEKS